MMLPPRAVLQLIRLIRSGDDDQPDAHVERAHHVRDGTRPLFLQPA